VAGVTRVKREGDGVRAWHSLARLLKRMSDGGATIHGFRSSFADWCREQTSRATLRGGFHGPLPLFWRFGSFITIAKST
jgi:hypothetical protein